MLLEVLMGISFFAGVILWLVYGLVGAGYGDNRVKIAAVTCCLVFLLSLTGTIILYNEDHKSLQLEGTERIVALQDNKDVNGRFYIGSGRIEESLYYYYMVDLGSRYKSNKVKADNSYIYVTDKDFRVEWWKTRHDWWIFHAVDDGYTWCIYVPNGTILTDHNIDLQ